MARKHKAASTHRTGRASALKPGSNATAGSHWSHGSAAFHYGRQKDAVLTDRLPVPGIIRHKELVTRLRRTGARSADTRVRWMSTMVRKLADLGNPGQPRPAWAELMARRRRKTLVVCPSCHHTIHGQPPPQLAS